MISECEKVKFISEGIELTGSVCNPVGIVNPPGVLFLHGGGESSKERYRKWQDHLCRLGISSFAFDFRGAGESEGKFSDGSLSNRLVDAQSALSFFLSENLIDKNKIAVVGSSMGAPIALRLCLETEKIRALILVSPAAYSKEAENQPLTDSFTKVIQRKNSWQDSPSFQILRNYKGSVMIIYGSKDSVIPEGVKKKYKQCLGIGNFYEVIENGSHTLLNPGNILEDEVFEELLKRSTKFLITNLYPI